MKQLYSSPSEDKARELRQFLIANGIEATVISNGRAAHSDSDSTRFSTWTVAVHDDDYDDARTEVKCFRKPPAQVTTATDDNSPSVESQRSRRWMTAQLAIVLLLTQPLFSPVDWLLRRSIASEIEPSFIQEWAIDVCYFLFMASIPLLMIRLSGERLSTYGLKPRNLSVDLVTGCLAYMCAWAVSIVGIDLFVTFATDLLGKPYEPPELLGYWTEAPRNVSYMLAMLVASISIGLGEELVTRAYLITTLERLLKSTPWSVVIAAAYFGICHVNASALGVWSAFLIGLVFGVFFVWTRRVWPLVFAHALFDFAVFILPPR